MNNGILCQTTVNLEKPETKKIKRKKCCPWRPLSSFIQVNCDMKALHARGTIILRARWINCWKGKQNMKAFT